VQAIAKVSQAITGLAATDTKTYGADSYPLSVTPGASSSPLTFTSSNTNVATIDSTGWVSIKGAGQTTITVNQAGDASYEAASLVQLTLVVVKANQSINFGALAGKTLGEPAFGLLATASSSLAVSYSSSDTSVATITGSTVNILKPGSTVITANQAGNDNYNAASPVTQTLVVSNPGSTFSSVFGTSINPTNVGADGLTYLMKYSYGGTNTNDKVTLPTVSISGTNLTLSAIVRTNDTNLNIVGQVVTNLSSAWSDLATNPKGTPSANTNNVPAGCQRRDFTANGGSNNRTFLRLKATQNP
jgi:hypothetical protein